MDTEKILYDFMNMLQIRYEKGEKVQGVRIDYKTLDKESNLESDLEELLNYKKGIITKF